MKNGSKLFGSDRVQQKAPLERSIIDTRGVIGLIDIPKSGPPHTQTWCGCHKEQQKQEQ